jgi:hypothetical protein
VGQTLRQRASALFVHQVHFRVHRVHRSLLPIGQSLIRLIVVRSSTSSLTRHLSCGAWAPAKSGGDCWHDLHVPLGDVRTQYFVIASAITTLVAAWRNLVNIASNNDNNKINDQCISCDGGNRDTSFIAGNMTLYCNDEGSRSMQSIL